MVVFHFSVISSFIAKSGLQLDGLRGVQIVGGHLFVWHSQGLLRHLGKTLHDGMKGSIDFPQMVANLDPGLSWRM